MATVIFIIFFIAILALAAGLIAWRLKAEDAAYHRRLDRTEAIRKQVTSDLLQKAKDDAALQKAMPTPPSATGNPELDKMLNDIYKQLGYQAESSPEPVGPVADDPCPECGNLFAVTDDYICPDCREKR